MRVFALANDTEAQQFYETQGGVGCGVTKGINIGEHTAQLAWIIHENIHRIGLVADGGLAGSQSPLWTPKSALRPLQPVYRGGCSARCGQSD